MRHYTSPKPSATTTNVATTMCIVEQPRGMRERERKQFGGGGPFTVCTDQPESHDCA